MWTALEYQSFSKLINKRILTDLKNCLNLKYAENRWRGVIIKLKNQNVNSSSPNNVHKEASQQQQQKKASK